MLLPQAAFLEEVDTRLAQGMKQGGSALGRAVEATIDKRVGRGRAKASWDGETLPDAVGPSGDGDHS